MASRLPRERKPAGQLRRRNAPETWIALPPDGCKLPVPKWPSGKASSDEAALWKRLWSSPVACWWHDQRVDASVIARYVELRFSHPALAVLSRIEAELGLTPASLMRLRLIVEHPEPQAEQGEDPYQHLRSVSG